MSAVYPHPIEIPISHANDNDMIAMIRKQIDYYFSKENLATDAYLVSQMDANLYVPLTTVLNFAKIRSLTDKTEVLIEAIKMSNFCTLNEEETAIRPNIMNERNTIILRDIPSETTEEELRLFLSEYCQNIDTIRLDVGNMWFVTFTTEQDAKNAILSLRTSNFKNQPVKARLKSENILRVMNGNTSPRVPVPSTYENNAIPFQNFYSPHAHTYYPQGFCNGYGMDNYYMNPHSRCDRRGFYGRRYPRYSPNIRKDNNNNRPSKPIKRSTAPIAGNRKFKKNNRIDNNYRQKNSDATKNVVHQPLLSPANFPPLSSSTTVTPEKNAKYETASDDTTDIQTNKQQYTVDPASKRKTLAGILREQNKLNEFRTASPQKKKVDTATDSNIRNPNEVSTTPQNKEKECNEQNENPRDDTTNSSSISEETMETVILTVNTSFQISAEKNEVRSPEPMSEPQPKIAGYADALKNGKPLPKPKPSPKVDSISKTPVKASTSSANETVENNKTPKNEASVPNKKSRAQKKDRRDNHKNGRPRMKEERPVAKTFTASLHSWGDKPCFLELLKSKEIDSEKKNAVVSEAK